MQPAGAGGGQQATAHRGPGGGESQGQLGPNSDRVAAPALAPNQLNVSEFYQKTLLLWDII